MTVVISGYINPDGSIAKGNSGNFTCSPEPGIGYLIKFIDVPFGDTTPVVIVTIDSTDLQKTQPNMPYVCASSVQSVTSAGCTILIQNLTPTPVPAGINLVVFGPNPS